MVNQKQLEDGTWVDDEPYPLYQNSFGMILENTVFKFWYWLCRKVNK